MDKNRRKLLLGTGAGALGFATLEANHLIDSTQRFIFNGGVQTKDSLNGNSLDPEAKVDLYSGKVSYNEAQRFAFNKCLGCYSGCSIKLRIDNKSDKILRVTGNPYSPTSALKPLDYTASINQAISDYSNFQEQGVKHTSSACGRGSAVLDTIDHKNRITHCLKRVGHRGSGQWRKIPYEQLIQEVITGGNLFNEGHVEGLRDIRNFDKIANPDAPEFGPQTNQLLATTNPMIRNRGWFFRRFAQHSYGTVNIGHKGPYCGLQQYVGGGCAYGDNTIYDFPTVDFEHCKFAIFIGSNPTQSSDGFKRQAKLLSNARSENGMKYATVQPVMRGDSTFSVKEQSRWVAVKPSGDVPLIFGILHKIFELNRANLSYLSNPSQSVANTHGETTYTNGSHLLLIEPNQPPEFLAYEDVFESATTESVHKKEEIIEVEGAKVKLSSHRKRRLVIDAKNKEMIAADEAKGPSLPFYTGQATLKDGRNVKVTTALSHFYNYINEKSVEEYSELSGASIEDITWLAHEWTNHGRQVAALTGSGASGTDSSQMAYAVAMLNLVVGNVNAKGGVVPMSGTHLGNATTSPRYNLEIKNAAPSSGFHASRHMAKYELSTEYNNKVKNGQNPYPSDQPWFSIMPPASSSELLLSHANQNPFPFKAWLMWRNNPFYSAPNVEPEVREAIISPEKLGLIISIDIAINETNRYSDYIVPDSVQYEEWAALPAAYANAKATTIGFPAITPRTEVNKAGKHICMEQFCIDVAKEMDLPGYGKEAISDNQGNHHDVNIPEDLYLRYFANIAYADSPVPDINHEEISLTSVNRILDKMKASLTEDEIKKVAYLFSRGGRFDSEEHKYTGEWTTNKYSGEFQIYNEGLTKNINSYSGKRYLGMPSLEPQKFWNGDPIRQIWSEADYPFLITGFKSNLINSFSIWLDRLRAIKPYGAVIVHIDDAKEYDIKNGDLVKIETPSNSVKSLVITTKSIARKTIAIEHGFGHTQYGGSKYSIDGELFEADSSKRAGICINDLVIRDNSRNGRSLLQDSATGATIRHSMPGKITLLKRA